MQHAVGQEKAKKWKKERVKFIWYFQVVVDQTKNYIFYCIF